MNADPRPQAPFASVHEERHYWQQTDKIAKRLRETMSNQELASFLRGNRYGPELAAARIVAAERLEGLGQEPANGK